MSQLEFVSLHHKTHVAELWHGPSGSGEDWAGGDLVSGYTAAVRAVYDGLVEAGLHPSGEPINMAASSSVWVSAILRAKAEGLPVRYVIAPFASLPWKEKELVCVGVTGQQAEGYVRNLYRDAEYVVHPRTAAAYCALQTHRVRLGEATPSVVLATESPYLAKEQLVRLLGLEKPLETVITQSRKRFLEY